MRISSSQMYSQITNSLLKQEAAYGRLVEQLSSGRRLLSPADDPLAASQSINVAQNMALNQTYANNRATAGQTLNAQESALGSIGLSMQGVLTRVVQAGNGTLSDTDRRTLATELTATREALLGLANTTDGNGSYIFAGFDSERAPYAQDGTYQIGADRNQAPNVQVGQSRVMSIGDVASNIFGRANPGSGGHIVSADIGADSTAAFGKLVYAQGGSAAASRDVTFFDDNGTLSYRVSVAGQPDQVHAYTEGTALDLGDGLSMPIKGSPVAGDTFSIDKTQDAGVDIFAALDSLIAGLNAPTTDDPAAAAAWSNTLSTATNILQNGYDNILTVRAGVGAKMQEVDALDSVGTDKALSYAKQLSGLEEVNVTATYSEALQRMSALTAAGMAFQAIQNLNLFTRK